MLDGYSSYPFPASHGDTEQHCSPCHRIMQQLHFAFEPYVTATLCHDQHIKKKIQKSSAHHTFIPSHTKQFTQWQTACYFIVPSNCHASLHRSFQAEYGQSQNMAWVLNEFLHSLVPPQGVLCMGCQGSLAQQAVAPGRASSPLHSHCLLYTDS